MIKVNRGGRRSGRAGGTAASGADVLASGAAVPTREEVLGGKATYGGITVKYDSKMSADARNMTTEIHVSPKFFEHPVSTQRHILNHEVAHNLSDDMMFRNSDRWQAFSGKFIKEKEVPKGSLAYERGQRTYWEGLYGDIGATALSETVTRAITEYLDAPTALRNRSKEAFNEIRKYMKSR